MSDLHPTRPSAHWGQANASIYGASNDAREFISKYKEMVNSVPQDVQFTFFDGKQYCIPNFAKMFHMVAGEGWILEDAPSDGFQYGRQNGEWTKVGESNEGDCVEELRFKSTELGVACEDGVRLSLIEDSYGYIGHDLVLENANFIVKHDSKDMVAGIGDGFFLSGESEFPGFGQMEYHHRFYDGSLALTWTKKTADGEQPTNMFIGYDWDSRRNVIKMTKGTGEGSVAEIEMQDFIRALQNLV